MADGTVITSVTDALAVCSSIIESANNEVVYLSPPSLLVLASEFGLGEKTKMLMQKGGRVRGIADFSYPYIKEIRERVDNGEDVRYVSQYQGMFMLVGDRRESIQLVERHCRKSFYRYPRCSTLERQPHLCRVPYV